MQPLGKVYADFCTHVVPILEKAQSDMVQYATPVLQNAYDNAAPYITPYIPNAISHIAVTSSLVGASAGHIFARFVGEQAGFTSSLAIAYTGAHLMDSESTKALVITAGLQLLPSIIKRVTADVLSQTILGAGTLGIKAGVSLIALPFRAIGSVFSSDNKKEQKIIEQAERIKSLKKSKRTLKTEINDLKAELRSLKCIVAPAPSTEKAKVAPIHEVKAD